MFHITDVIKHLLIINLIMFFGSMLMQQTGFLDPSLLACYYPDSEFFRPYQVVTHMFMHGGGFHLFFNMFALVMLGPYVESFLGAKRFLIMYFISGFGALGIHMLVWYIQFMSVSPQEYYSLMHNEHLAVVGASGAVYGVLAAFALLFPNTKLMLLIPPIPVKAKYLVLGLVAFDLFSGFTGYQSGIAHFAHVGGALFGFLTLMFWRGKTRRR
jgi:membrane associated rhomboid family serine protease